MNQLITLLLLISCLNQPLSGMSLLPSSYQAARAYEAKDFPQAEHLLLAKQVEKPLDPLVNYNLGLVQYQQEKFAQARESFGRAAEFGDVVMQEVAAFNAGNNSFKHALSLLGDDWEEKQLKDEVQLKAAALAQDAVHSYDKTLKRRAENESAKTNKKFAEELLEKLQKKQQQQQEEQQKSKSCKNPQQKPGDGKQGAEQEPQEQQDKQERDARDKRDNEQKRDRKDQERNEQSDGERGQDRKKDHAAQKEQNDKQNQADTLPEKSQQSSADRKPEQQKDQTEQSMEAQAVRAVLEKLQGDESQLHKSIMKQHTQGGGSRQGGKNW